MQRKRRSTMLAVCYLLMAVSVIAYELGIRVFDRGNSEFAGMLSAAVTLPASLAMISAGKSVFGVNPGDSDAAFVAILGLSALLNAGLVWTIMTALTRRT